MTTSYASVHTQRARDYLVELGLIWHHTISAKASMEVVIPFPLGLCEISATEDLLQISLIAKSNYEIALLEDLISDQLDGMSEGEDLHYQWLRPSDDGTGATQTTGGK
jgi:hypothetical protein